MTAFNPHLKPKLIRLHPIFRDLYITDGNPVLAGSDDRDCTICHESLLDDSSSTDVESSSIDKVTANPSDDQVRDNQVLTHIGCRRSYHRTCLEQWLYNKQPCTCPFRDRLHMKRTINKRNSDKKERGLARRHKNRVLDDNTETVTSLLLGIDQPCYPALRSAWVAGGDLCDVPEEFVYQLTGAQRLERARYILNGNLMGRHAVITGETVVFGDREDVPSNQRLRYYAAVNRFKARAPRRASKAYPAPTNTLRASIRWLLSNEYTTKWSRLSTFPGPRLVPGPKLLGPYYN